MYKRQDRKQKYLFPFKSLTEMLLIYTYGRLFLTIAVSGFWNSKERKLKWPFITGIVSADIEPNRAADSDCSVNPPWILSTDLKTQEQLYISS